MIQPDRPGMTHKECRICEETKPLSAFGRQHTSAMRKLTRHVCKECVSAQNRATQLCKQNIVEEQRVTRTQVHLEQREYDRAAMNQRLVELGLI